MFMLTSVMRVCERAWEPVKGGRCVFCTGFLFLQTGTRASQRLKTGKNRRAFDDGSGPAALWSARDSSAQASRRWRSSATSQTRRTFPTRGGRSCWYKTIIWHMAAPQAVTVPLDHVSWAKEVPEDESQAKGTKKRYTFPLSW